MNTLTRAGLSEAIFAEVGLPRSESTKLVEALLEQIGAALERGEAVKISSFGTFSARRKGPRVGRNPKTGVEAKISPRRTLSFKPSQLLRARVNGAAKPSET